MIKKIVESIKKWFATNKYGLVGFAVGIAVVLAAAGVYRISWEFPEAPPVQSPPTVSPQTKTTVTPTPAATPKPGAPIPQRPAKAKPVLKKLNGPPDMLRRLQEQQNQQSTNTP